MPKRQNPFGDSSPLQFKSRISTKEVNLGVSAKQKMQLVYDKTKAKMFEGARHMAVPGNGCLTETPETIIPLPGQLRLDAGGKLQPYPDHSHQPMETQNMALQSFFNNNNTNLSVSQVKAGQRQINAFGQLTEAAKVKKCSFQGASPLPTQCHSCSQLISGTLTACGFCEKRQCSNCMHTCHQCQNKYCHVCSILNYDDFAERAFCLQCSP